MKIAVIGAGMAGAACASTLTAQGHDVTVFDKGRGLGGRLAQRRRAGAVFDHGAQYFTARDPLFQEKVKIWRQRGIAAPWPLAHKAGEDVWIGVPGMSQPVKELLGGVETVTRSLVAGLRREPGNWRLVIDGGGEAGPFDRVGLAIPQPQAIRLLQDLDIETRLMDRLCNVAMAPCWTGLFAFESELGSGLTDGPVTHRVLNWVARNNSKLGRDGLNAWTVHARHDWSRTNLECEPQEILPQLSKAFAGLAGGNLPQIRHAECHRWRFAFVEKALGEPALATGDMGIVLMGDWCLGPRIEAAFLSGLAGAAMLANRS